MCYDCWLPHILVFPIAQKSTFLVTNLCRWWSSIHFLLAHIFFNPLFQHWFIFALIYSTNWQAVDIMRSLHLWSVPRPCICIGNWFIDLLKRLIHVMKVTHPPTLSASSSVLFKASSIPSDTHTLTVIILWTSQQGYANWPPLLHLQNTQPDWNGSNCVLLGAHARHMFWTCYRT